MKIIRIIPGKNFKEIKDKIDMMKRLNGTFEFKILERTNTYWKIIISGDE